MAFCPVRTHIRYPRKPQKSQEIVENLRKSLEILENTRELLENPRKFQKIIVNDFKNFRKIGKRDTPFCQNFRKNTKRDTPFYHFFPKKKVLFLGPPNDQFLNFVVLRPCCSQGPSLYRLGILCIGPIQRIPSLYREEP